MPWLPMALAPRDRRITIQAERWTHQGERRRVETFPGCKWCEGGTCRHPAPYWRGLPTGWTPLGWAPPPSTPASAPDNPAISAP